ncbi:unnamed protein product [Caenorhabditis auriculariae]|uniref:Uncharacterized protein n=1 Tax=Caenorhabditis auriculariae TaxID=2777116 RepID=A0A8S1GRL2_9PELO|nr:unnamed protein product [Caenorhabditis auriculariae]
MRNFRRWHNIFLVHLLESKKCAFMRNDVALNDGIVMDDLRVGDIVKVDMIKKGNSNDVLKQLEVTRLCEVEPRCFEHIKGNKIMGSVDKTVTGDGYELKNDAIGVISDPHKSCSSFPEGRHEVTIFLPPLNFYNNHLNSTTAFCDAFPFLVDHRAIEINPFVSQNELIRCEGIVVHQRNLFNDPMLFIFTKGCSPYTDILAILPENTGFRLGTFVSFMMLKADYEKRATKKKLQTDFSTIRQIDPPGGITSDVGAFDDIVRITIKDFSTTESTGPYTHEWIGNFDDPNRKTCSKPLESVDGVNCIPLFSSKSLADC